MKDMAVHRYLLLIIVLCCADVECVKRLQRESETVDLNILPEDLTDEKRDVRSLKSKHRLRTGDAEKVAQYFNNGGPMAGHSHFVKAFNTIAQDSTDHAINSFSDVNKNNIKSESEFLSVPIISANYRDSWKSPLSVVPEAASPDVETYSTNHPIFDYPTTNGLYDTLMGVPHHTRHHSHHLHRNPLLRALNLPKHILHNLLGHHVHHYHYYPAHHRRNALVRSTNNQDTVAASNPMSDNSQYDAEMSPISDINTTHQPMQYYYQPDTGYYYTPYSNPLMNPYPLNYYSPSFHTPLVPCSIVPSHWQDTPKQTKIPTAKTDDNVAKINNVDEKKTKTKVKNDKSK
ncbi:uncharacterized protein LOC109853855 isoform X2 [Pseudomyrmex gracilis]|uniref:uncharacterized protein LOC109853855 isoform X2 n=1 Tax=Pseudomyrmex gracilis TaxID=219809 RepID=UPI000994EBC4|nr:uncharacterized protein LOC109853855 isoform X2 [Pseudomyrmex gracilis]